MTRPAHDREDEDDDGPEPPRGRALGSRPDDESYGAEEFADADDLEVDLEVDEEDFDDDSDEDDSEEEEGEGGEAAAASGEADGEQPKKKRKKDAKDAEPDPGDPQTPVPTKKKMLAALEWAFAEENDVTPALLDAFAEHALLVLERNRVMNLTAIHDPKEVAAKHYLDSWRITRLVPLIAKEVLDLGTGAGLPGLPVALAEPNLAMTLCDSTKKKVDFLEECIQKLGARNVRAVWDRAEEYLMRARVDIVLVRAVSSVRENIRTVRKVRHSLADMVMLKGNSWSREVRAAEREAERLGFKLDTVWEHELPGEMGSRAILVYRAPGGAGF